MTAGAGLTSAAFSCGFGCMVEPLLSVLAFSVGASVFGFSSGFFSAGVGAGAGIAYLKGGGFEQIAHTVVNAVAVTSGIICDGAKASCAAKIAAAVDAGILGLTMYENGNEFFGGDGIVKKGVEKTIDTVGRLARIGMEQTDKEIIHLMMES